MQLKRDSFKKLKSSIIFTTYSSQGCLKQVIQWAHIALVHAIGAYKVCVLDLVQLEDDIDYIQSSHTDLSSSN